ncbi:MAG: hypothetical protein AB1454_03695 [Candidatus Auribacterota bacterium]
MDVAKFLKEWKNNLILLCILAVLLIGIVYLAITAVGMWNERRKSFNNMISVREQYNSFMLKNKEVASNKLISEYQAHAEELKKYYNDIFKIMSSQKKNVAEVSALEYKQQLLNQQRQIREMAEERGVYIPADLGFREYMGEKIPPDTAIPLLSLQLEIITSLINDLFESGVTRIEAISRKKSEKDSLLKTKLPFSITIKTDMKGLISFLDILQSKSEIYIVDSINIDTIPLDKFRQENNLGHLLEVNMTLKYVEL